MAGQHWGERDGESSGVENALIGIFSTVAALGFYGSLLMAAVALLRAANLLGNRRERRRHNSGQVRRRHADD
jgi:hypothetical protein